jgi:hypothetical protein
MPVFYINISQPYGMVYSYEDKFGFREMFSNLV